MKKQIAACVLAIAMAFTMLPTSAFASAEDALIPTAETTGEASNAANPSAAPEQSAAETGSNANGSPAPSATEDEPSQEEKAAETDSSTNGNPAPSAAEEEPSQEEKAAETDSSTNGKAAPSATEDEPSQEENAAETGSSTNGSPALSATEEEPSQEDTSIAPFAETPHKVSDEYELENALKEIAASPETEATIVLTDNVTAPSIWDGVNNISSFGASGKHITVKSAEGGMKKLSFASRCTLNGDCTFDDVDVTGGSLFCNGHKTIFTENGQIHLKGTLYGGGYQTTVDSTHVEIAASGSITPNSYISLHDVIGGSYQGSVEGDTYLAITGNIQMQGDHHLNPGCMGTDVYVGGDATLIYDNKNTDTSPAIEGTYGCEMKGDVTLDVRSGSVSGIVGTGNSSKDSIIRGDLHIMAGYLNYENTDSVLRLGNYNTIVGADNSSNIIDGSTVGRNITIDTYENVWGWDKNKDPDPYDNPLQIFGALYGTVGGDITINAHGSHLTNIYGAGDSTVQGSVSVNATNVDLNDPYFVEGDVVGLWEYDKLCTVGGPVTVTVDGGDVGHVMVTTHTTVPAGSSIKVTRKPKIRDSICGAQSGASSANLPVANVSACEAEIPLIKKMSQVNITGNSKVTVQDMTDDAGLLVDEGSTLTTDLEPISIQGNTVINGTWEQLSNQAAYGYSDIFVSGTTQIGPRGRLINHGTSSLKGTVTNNGVMALMGSALFQGDYTANSGELRLPAVAKGKNYNTGKIPLQIKGLSTGTTTVNTVEPADWSTLKKPNLGDNYILSKKNTDSPAQDVFVLGNADALADAWFLKRMPDADGSDDYYMWQVANSIRVVFDKNGGDTEASPSVMMQDKVVGVVNHFDLPMTEPTRSGCKFTGWNTKPDGTGEAFTAETDVTESLTVYAQWQPVSSTENGGSTGGNSGRTGSNSGSTSGNSGSNSAAKAEQGSQPVSHAVSDAAASTSPKTGDASALSLWAAVMAVSILGLAGICMAAKVHHRSKK